MKIVPLLLLLLTFSCTDADMAKTKASVPQDNVSNTQPWLLKVRETTRISGDHFSDMVIDSKHNSYIASFFTIDRVDYIYIAKIDPSGKIVWEIDGENKGRAGAISIDQNDNIWVTGYFNTKIQLGERTAHSDDNSFFLAQINPDGVCEKLITSEGYAYGLNCHVNAQGDIMVNGMYDSSFKIGAQQLTKPNNQNGNNFIAIFNKTGTCHYLNNHTGYIRRIRSDSKNDFYLAGEFYDSFCLGKYQLSTDGQYDNDAFVLKMNPQGTVQWLNQYGHKGQFRYGYRSTEGAADLWVTPDDQIVVLCAMELTMGLPLQPQNKNQGTIDAVALTLRPDGTLAGERMLATQLARNLAMTLTQTVDEHFYVTFTCQNGCQVADEIPLQFNDPFKSVLAEFDKNWNFQQLDYANDGTDATFRASYARDSVVRWSGHFREQLSFREQNVRNDAFPKRHNLFLLNR